MVGLTPSLGHPTLLRASGRLFTPASLLLGESIGGKGKEVTVGSSASFHCLVELISHLTSFFVRVRQAILLVQILPC